MIGRWLYLWYRRVLRGLPSCVRDITIAWWKNFNSYTSTPETIVGVIDFDGIDDSITFSGASPDVTGNKTIKFDCQFVEGVSQTTVNQGLWFQFITDTSDYFVAQLAIESGSPAIATVVGNSSNTVGAKRYDLSSSLLGEKLSIEITKTSTEITSFKVNGSTISPAVVLSGSDYPAGDYIGSFRGIVYTISNESAYFWNLEIVSSHQYDGIPDGNTNAAWVDDIGTADGTVNGSPSKVDISPGTPYVEEEIGTRIDTVYYGQYLDATSGQINLYRTTGTYDYTDPSTGNSVTSNAIPGSGLITVPANGICEIITSDGSEYPVCERAGTVLHDVENGIHISVATPSWSETLYGSDYLNQCGFVDKELSDQQGLPWETVVDGSDVALDDDTLVPVKKNEYINDLDGVLDLIL